MAPLTERRRAEQLRRRVATRSAKSIGARQDGGRDRFNDRPSGDKLREGKTNRDTDFKGNFGKNNDAKDGDRDRGDGFGGRGGGGGGGGGKDNDDFGKDNDRNRGKALSANRGKDNNNIGGGGGGGKDNGGKGGGPGNRDGGGKGNGNDPAATISDAASSAASSAASAAVPPPSTTPEVLPVDPAGGSDRNAAQQPSASDVLAAPSPPSAVTGGAAPTADPTSVAAIAVSATSPDSTTIVIPTTLLLTAPDRVITSISPARTTVVPERPLASDKDVSLTAFGASPSASNSPGSTSNEGAAPTAQGRRIDPDAERVIITVGSIGGVIAMFVICWVVWRGISKKKRSAEGSVATGSAGSARRPRFFNRFTPKIPFVGRQQKSWQNLDDEPRATMRKSQPVIPETPASRSAFGEKNSFATESQADELPRQESQQNFSLPAVSSSPSSDPAQSGMINAVSPVSAYQPTGILSTDVSTFSHQPADSVSSTNAALFMMSPRTDVNESFRPPLPGKGLSQPGLVRQPSRPTDHTRLQVNRTSELSSISSGFGDGDIIIPPVPPLPESVYQAGSSIYGRSVTGTNAGNTATRSSWLSRKSLSNRDTVYTAASEDGPPRFRSVNSWVNQQTGRMKRAEKDRAVTADPDAPPLPGGYGMMPPEQNWGMMDDDEVARSPATMDNNSTVPRR